MGINIQIDWSWFYTFLLVTLNLALAVFPRLRRDWEPLLVWGVSLVAAIVFFASVLLHELAHSLITKAQGMEVPSITLFLFGGVSNIQRAPPSPIAEFLISVVGPITSVVLGAGVLWRTRGEASYSSGRSPPCYSGWGRSTSSSAC
ncbi:MAG: site-2 protease family protein [Chloroflexota bacterium]|nr:site-2 protease family protein [Chloroflexota bacterium]